MPPSLLHPDGAVREVEVIVDDNDVVEVALEKGNDPADRGAAQVHERPRLRQHDRRPGDVAFPGIGVKLLAPQGNSVFLGQLIKDEKPHVVPGELVPVSRIPESYDELHESHKP